jgi:hypothetical protein
MRISTKKRERIVEQILAHLFSINPNAIFTSQIAEEIARDEEFVKKILLEIKAKGLVIEIKQNPKGVVYSRRARWKLSESAYLAYNNHQ